MPGTEARPVSLDPRLAIARRSRPRYAWEVDGGGNSRARSAARQVGAGCREGCDHGRFARTHRRAEGLRCRVTPKLSSGS